MIRAGNENLRKYFRPFRRFRVIIIVADVPFGVAKPAAVAAIVTRFSKRVTHSDTFRQAGKGVAWALPRAVPPTAVNVTPSGDKVNFH